VFGSNRYRYRYRDLADLLLISRQETVPGQAVTQALHREADRRQVAASARLERAVRRLREPALAVFGVHPARRLPTRPIQAGMTTTAPFCGDFT
jgi:hypothetical protein